MICAPLGIAAWVMGNNDLREMGAGMMDPSGRDQTNAGRICGIIGTILFILSLLLLVVYFVIFGAFFAAAVNESRNDFKKNAPPIEYTPAPER